MAKKTLSTWLKSAWEQVVALVIRLLWNPTDLPGCLVWLRASRGVYTTGNLVTTWVDQMGKHTVAAPNVVERPTYVAKSNALHGRPAIRFSGNEEILEKEGGLTLPFEQEPFSAFVVVSQANAGVDNGAAIVWSGAGAHVGLGLTSSNVFIGYLEHSYSSEVTLLSGKPYVLGVVYDGDRATLYVNGLATKTFTEVAMWQANSSASARFCVGGETASSNNFRGDIGDVVIYGRALTAPEIAKLSWQLVAHYDIANGSSGGWLGKLKSFVKQLFAAFGGTSALP